MMLKIQKNVKLPVPEEGQMNKVTLTALKKSIKHWEENVAAETPDEVNLYTSACALCKVFLNWAQPAALCEGCPVMAHSGMELCIDTPWLAAERAWSRWARSRSKSARVQEKLRKAWVIAATRELEFLRSLLPAKRKKKRK